MTLRYAANLAATAEAAFLKHKKIGAHGVDIAISPADILDMTQLGQLHRPRPTRRDVCAAAAEVLQQRQRTVD